MDTLGPSDSFQFDRFRLHSRDGCLLRRDAAGTWTPVAIGSRAVAVLGVLIDRHGDIVSKDEIMRVVWPGTVVGEGNLTVQISALRRVLDEGENGGQLYSDNPRQGISVRPSPDGTGVSGYARRSGCGRTCQANSSAQAFKTLACRAVFRCSRSPFW